MNEVQIRRPKITCGHSSISGNGTFICELELNHRGWHERSVKLLGGTERTNWGDDGKATWASNDDKRRAGR